MENKIIYRKIEKKDYSEIKNIINQSFNLHNYIPSEKILNCYLNSYIYSCLSEGTFFCVAEENGKIIGVIIGNAKKDYSFFKHVTSLTKLMYYNLKMKILCRKIAKENKGNISMHNAYSNFLSNAENDYDGVLTLFAVTKESRGKGVGTALLAKLMTYYNEKNVERIYLFTDSSCNFSFYENNGFKRLQTELVPLKTNDNKIIMEAYFYELKLR